MVASIIWQKRALPIYWHFLGKEGYSNLAQQQGTIRPILKLLTDYEIVLIGDREFHSVHLAYWLKTRTSRKGKVYFALRQKQDTYIRIRKSIFFSIKPRKSQLSHLQKMIIIITYLEGRLFILN
ncbi:MAG: hypothetical protein F6K58_10975 [Symploca sp. SIO2E9]|nr:hypothetical protein [Symploca sp. SIO2E9]